MGNLETGGGEMGNLEPAEEIMSLEEDDEAEFLSDIGQDGNVTGQVESKTDPLPAPDPEVMHSANIRGHLTGPHSVYQIL